MKFSYYPGCSLHATAREYDLSFKAVCQELKIDIEEIPDWNCCGATPAHQVSDYLTFALPLRNLVLAERMGQDVIIPCASCYNSLKGADCVVKSGNKKVAEVNAGVGEVMGAPYKASLEVRHPVDIMAGDEMMAELENKIVNPLKGLKVVCYYGCLLNRPYEVAFDNPEQPVKMDKILEKLGATVVPWSYKVDCCGGSLSVTEVDITNTLTKRLLDGARQAGADAIITACPLCQGNLDNRQKDILEAIGHKTIPIYYFTELMGIAMNISGSKDWLKKHITNATPLLESLKLI